MMEVTTWPLMIAARGGDVPVVQWLVTEGADVNHQTVEGVTALGKAAECGNYECVKTLIQAGADVNIGEMNQTVGPSVLKSWRRNHGLVAKEQRTDETYKQKFTENGCKNYGFGWFVSENNSENSCHQPSPYNHGFTVLMRAVRESPTDCKDPRYEEYLKCIEALLNSGANVNSVTINGATALGYAITRSNCQCVKLLINNGADVNMWDVHGNPLIVKAALVNVNILELLLTVGADVNSVNRDGYSPLVALAQAVKVRNLGNVVESVKLLLKSGAAVNHVNKNNLDALEIICDKMSRVHNSRTGTGAESRTDMCKVLYAAGERMPYIGYFLEQTRVSYQGQILEQPRALNLGHFLELDWDLNHLCREAIRTHLIDLDQHENLFRRIGRLGLPRLLHEYLLYGVSLESDVMC